MRTKTKILFAISFLIASFTSSNLAAQSCSGNFLSDDFSNASLWTVMGTHTINGSSLAPGNLLVNTTTQTLQYNNFRGRQTHRLVRSVGCTLNSTDVFRAEFEYEMGTSTSDYGAHPFLLSTDTNSIYSNASADPTPSNNSFIQVLIGDPYGSGSNQVTAQIRGRYQTTAQSASQKINLNKNVKYYFRVERIAAGEAILSIFSNSTYTTHITGSPVCYDLDDRITDLKYLQYGVSTTSSPTRTANIHIDNLEMYDNVIGNCGAVCDVTASMSHHFTGCEYEFFNGSSVGPGNTFMGSFINFDDGSYNSIDLGGSVLHTYNRADRYLPCITTFSYIFDGEKYVCCSDVFCYEEEIHFEECENPDTSIPLQEEIPCEIDANFTATVDCEGNVSFKNLSTMASGFHLTTVVDFGNGTNPIEVTLGEDFDYQYTQNGTYTVCITVFGYSISANGDFECCSKEYCETITVKTVDDPCDGEPQHPFRVKAPNQEESLFSVAPNPVINELKITLKAGNNDVRIFSVDGRLIERFFIQDQSIKTLSMDKFSNGIYYISVQNGGKIETQKVIKQ